MKVIIIAFALTILSTLATAQNGWRYIGPVESEIQAMAVHEDLILCAAATIGGDRLFRSTDAGMTWDTLASGVRKMAIIPDGIPTIVGSVPPNKDFLISTDMGDTWDTTGTPPPGIWLSRIYIKEDSPGLIFAIAGPSSLRYERLYRSTDYGRSWTYAYNFPASSDGSNIVVGISPNSPDVYVNVDTDIGGAYFFHSSDDGVTWEFVAESPCCLTTLLIDPDAPGRILATFGNQVLLSENGGILWRSIHTGNDDKRAFRSLIRNSKMAHELYLLIEPNSHFDLPGTISCSQSRGFSWTIDSSSLGLPYGAPIDPRVMTTWLQHDANPNRLYIQTEKGIYIREITSTNIAPTNLPLSALIQVYPQPANGSMTVNIEMPATSGATIRLYNTLGLMVHEWFMSGANGFQWDLRDRHDRALSSGVYLLTVATGQNVVTRQIVIQR